MSLSILLVEDNALNRELVRDLLELGGHRVEVLASGAAFRVWLRAPDRAAVDLVLMDIRLRDADGTVLLGELRRDGGASVPVVAVTAHAHADEIAELGRAGFDGVLTKPIDTRTFVECIEAHARRC